MKIRARNKKKGIFDDTGIFSDLAFLLLIFFLAVGTFVPLHGIASRTGSAVSDKTGIELILDREGFVYEGKRVTTFMAGQKVSAGLVAGKDIPVILLVKGDVAYQQVVDAVGLLKKWGAGDFSLSLLEEIRK